MQNFLKPAELKRLETTLARALATEQPERILGFSAIRLLLHTGMRKGEVRRWIRQRVDLDHHVIHSHAAEQAAETHSRDILLFRRRRSRSASPGKAPARGDFVFLPQAPQQHLIDPGTFSKPGAGSRTGCSTSASTTCAAAGPPRTSRRGPACVVIGELLDDREPRTRRPLRARVSGAAIEAHKLWCRRDVGDDLDPRNQGERPSARSWASLRRPGPHGREQR